MNLILSPELEDLIQEKVKSGNYNSASEVIREALGLLKAQCQLREIRTPNRKSLSNFYFGFDKDFF